MKILFVIPHYFGCGTGLYESTKPSARSGKIRSLENCIASIHQHFGNGQRQLLAEDAICQANSSLSHDVDVVICTHGNSHLLAELALPPASFRQHSATRLDNPKLLGYACYDVFRDAFGSYDWYCFLEDDIVITDPLFFSKLNWFYSCVGSARYLLQPNRYELTRTPLFSKVYLDGPLWSDGADFINEICVKPEKKEILIPFGDDPIRLTQAVNIHSGCFFLTEVHMAHMLEQPWYGQPVVGYADPLAAAANMYIISLFSVFKPAFECASFLEVYHSCQRYLDAGSNSQEFLSYSIPESRVDK